MVDRGLPPLDGVVYLTGNITQNFVVGPRSAGWLGGNLGLGGARLSAGWAIAVLKETLEAEDFELEGTTLRSGGREGLPKIRPELDRLRRREHDRILAERGREGYRSLQQLAMSGMALTGDKRVVKVITAAGHDGDENPAMQYPMGGGGPQWRLIRPRKFKIAMTVDGFGIARIPGFSAVLVGNVPYESRTRLARHIAEA